MGLTRINQLLAGIEATEGTPITLNSSHFVDARNLSRTYEQAIEDEVVSGASLDTDLGTVGRGSCGFSFSTRYYGLNEAIVPLDDPLLRASGMRATVIPYLTVSVAPTIATWPGMVLTDSSGGTAVLAAPITNGRCYYTGTGGTGTFPNGDVTLDVAGSAFTVSSATPAGTCWAYLPDSQPTAIVNLTGAWTGTAPIVGDIVTNNLNGVNAARGRVISLVGTLLEIEPALPGRAFLATETVQGTAAGRTGTNTVAAGGQVLNRVPSMTMKGNIGGHAILGTGMRGNCTIDMQAGRIPLANWEFSGSRSASTSEDPLTGVATVSASSIPRWQSAYLSLDGFEIPISTCQVAFGNTVSLIPDAHGSQGVRGSAITARQPTVTIDPDAVNQGVYNFMSRMENATAISFYTQWGTSNGLRMGIWIPRCQIYQQSDGDREGTSTRSLTLQAKRRTGDGDNSMYLLFGLQ